MKTGTTYLQHLMAENQEILRRQGVLFPGRKPRIDQIRGVRDVMDLYSDEELPTRFEGAWARLRAEMFEFDGHRSVVSQEFMSFARERRAQAIVASLAPATVHVVLTVREASRVLPSSWATSTRNRNTASWPEYVDALTAGPEAGGNQWQRVMRALDVPRMLADWGRQVPADRLHVVVVPPPTAPHSALWERFATVLGVAPGLVSSPSGRRGESYGYHSADFVRRVNTHLVDVPNWVSRRMKAYLLQEVLDRRIGEPKVPISAPVLAFADRWNAVTLEAIRSSGAHVYGDLSDLHLDAAAATVVDAVEPPPTEDLLRVATDALSGLRQMMHAEYAQVTPRLDDDSTVERWSNARDPVAAAAADVAAALREAEDLRVRKERDGHEAR